MDSTDATATAATAAEPAVEPVRRRRAYRADIDGLRGLAIALVVVFHVFVGRVSSGVDVFLLVGGIFFFAPQIRNALDPAGLTPLQSVLRILRRLYPALVTVVAVALVFALGVFSRVRWPETGEDAAASLLYVQNLHLAHLGQEYSALNREVSVFQHLWSMSVQMQVYLGALVVIVLLAALLRHRATARIVLYTLLTVATAASFLYAVWLGQHDQATNYYSPFSRFWEIGLGGLVGVVLLGRVLPAWWRSLRWVAGVVGVALIVCTGLVLDGAARFPGPWTLVPLAGAVLVVLAGTATENTSDRPVGVAVLLGTPPFRFLGRTAYCLYLWHWPVLVLVTHLLPDGGGVAQDVLSGVGVIVVSVLLAWATFRWIETPLRQGRRPQRASVLTTSYVRTAVSGRNGTVGAVSAAVLVVVSLTVVAVGTVGPVGGARDDADTSTRPGDVSRADYPGPDAFLHDAPVPDGVPVQPDPLGGEEGMLPATQTDGCFAGFAETNLILTQQFNSTDIPCAYGDTDSDRTVYLVGGSHSEHYLDALDHVAGQQGFRIVPILKTGCVLGLHLPHLSGEPFPECAEWDRNVRDYIAADPPTDGVMMTVTRPTTIQGDGPDQVPPEYVDVVREFTDAGIHTWGVRDTPWHLSSPAVKNNVLLCVAEQRDSRGGGDDGDCGSDEAASLAPVNPAVEAYRGLDVTDIDLTSALCRDGRCPGVIGNVLAYRDDQHFTSLFSSMLGPELGRQMYG